MYNQTFYTNINYKQFQNARKSIIWYENDSLNNAEETLLKYFKISLFRIKDNIKYEVCL